MSQPCGAELLEKPKSSLFREPFSDELEAASSLQGFEVIVAMRERTGFPASLLKQLPQLKLLVTTGMRNLSIDMEAAAEQGVDVCGTGMLGYPTAELTWALILALARNLNHEDQSMKEGNWHISLGTGLRGKNLGLYGLGKLGSQVARIGQAFGMYVIAAKESPLEKVLHTANVLAQYLDNDEDGFADDPNVLWQLVENNYIMPVWPIDGGADGLTVSEIRQKCSNVNIGAYMFIEDINGNGGDSYVFGGIANDNSFTNGGDGEWDANLEEIFHTVTWGWYRAYPEYFANGDWWPWTGIENKDLIGGKGELSSKLTTAMDAARGGWFEDTPDQYPDNAWYTYDDKSCGYGCQSMEYLYHLLMTNIGAYDPIHTPHCEDLKREWRGGCTKEELEQKDILGFELINNYGFNLPTNIPDGNYKGTP